MRLEESDILTDAVVAAPDYVYHSAVDSGRAKHSGEDVALFAIGPQSYLVGGVIEQNTIFHLITHAFGWELFEGGQNEQQ